MIKGYYKIARKFLPALARTVKASSPTREEFKADSDFAVRNLDYAIKDLFRGLYFHLSNKPISQAIRSNTGQINLKVPVIVFEHALEKYKDDIQKRIGEETYDEILHHLNIYKSLESDAIDAAVRNMQLADKQAGTLNNYPEITRDLKSNIWINPEKFLLGCISDGRKRNTLVSQVYKEHLVQEAIADPRKAANKIYEIAQQKMIKMGLAEENFIVMLEDLHDEAHQNVAAALPLVIQLFNHTSQSSPFSIFAAEQSPEMAEVFKLYIKYLRTSDPGERHSINQDFEDEFGSIQAQAAEIHEQVDRAVLKLFESVSLPKNIIDQVCSKEDEVYEYHESFEKDIVEFESEQPLIEQSWLFSAMVHAEFLARNPQIKYEAVDASLEVRRKFAAYSDYVDAVADVYNSLDDSKIDLKKRLKFVSKQLCDSRDKYMKQRDQAMATNLERLQKQGSIYLRSGSAHARRLFDDGSPTASDLLEYTKVPVVNMAIQIIPRERAKNESLLNRLARILCYRRDSSALFLKTNNPLIADTRRRNNPKTDLATAYDCILIAQEKDLQNARINNHDSSTRTSSEGRNNEKT